MTALPVSIPDKSKHPGRFKPGVSGNPGGRPRGRAGRRAKLLRDIEGDIPDLLRHVMDRALAGDMAAAGMLLNRTIPPLRPRGEPVLFDYDPNASPTVQCDLVLAAMSRGEVTLESGKLVLDALSARTAAALVETLEARVEALEASSNDH